MGRTATITLDGKEYLVHAFNMRELQEVGEIIGNGSAHIVSGMKILEIALRRAEPKVDLDTLEPKMPELNAAIPEILKLSGIEAEVPQAAAPAGN